MRRCRVEELEGAMHHLLKISEAAAHYLWHVLRLENGSCFEGFNGKGQTRIFKLINAEQRLVEIVGELTQKSEIAPILLCYGLPKGDKLETVVRQVTELGIQGVILWSAQRSVAIWEEKKQAQKHERLLKVMQEAARQCERSIDPSLSMPKNLKALIEATKHCPIKIFFDPTAEQGWQVSQAQIDLLSEQKPCALLIGPEGGISPEERAELLRHQWQGLVLNSPILRTETAAVVACTIALDRLGWMA
jgi:16S rRNA (uracil1498-N3)-methyltransferase